MRKLVDAPRKKKQWTEKEEAYLQDKWGTVSIKGLSKALGRSENAIIVRAQRLGCGAHLAGDTRISLNQLMLAIYGKNMLGYTSDRLIRYGLPVKWHVVKKNRFRVIDIDAFWKWAEDNKSILDFSRFEKYGLGAEPDWVDVKRKADYKKLQLHGQHNAAWTKTEDDKLRYLLSKGTYTYSDLAAELRHSEGAIKRRILDLGINKKPVRCPPPKMDGGRGGNLVPHGRRRLRFHTDRRKAEPDSVENTSGCRIRNITNDTTAGRMRTTNTRESEA